MMRRQASLGASPRRHWPLLIPAAVGLVFFVLAVIAAAPTLRLAAIATRTEGHFVGAVAKTGGNHGGSFFRPMFSYHTPDGSIRSFTARSGSTDQPYADGQTVTILYDPADPDHARLASFGELWIGPVILGVCGLFLIVLGTSLYVAFRRRDAEKY